MTSQILANIYLNEFDRFVRHVLRPQAYLRYGDDFIVITPNRHRVRKLRTQAKDFLEKKLGLYLHARNDVIVPAGAGLHFLGHVITDRYVVVDRHTTQTALAKSNRQSIASYKSLYLAKFPKRELDWRLLDELADEGIL